MKMVSKDTIGVRSDGKELVRALIQADTTPDPLPTTGENVAGMSANEVFAGLSVLYVTDPAALHQLYLADESGEFVAQ